MPLAPPSKNGLPSRNVSPQAENNGSADSRSAIPAAASNVGTRKKETTKDSEAWRKSGKAFRANLVLEDEEKGGNSFQLSKDCSIERYYRVAERVSCLLYLVQGSDLLLCVTTHEFLFLFM